MKKGDIVIIIVIIIIAFVSYMAVTLSRPAGSAVLITVDGALYRQFVLDEKAEEHFTVETEAGYNVIEVKDGAIAVIEADCRDQICVHTKAARKGGDKIICLPHKLIISIQGEEDGH
jgi:hypothetical protein